MASATTTGSPTPAVLLRAATDTRTATDVIPTIAGSTEIHESVTRMNACGAESSVPVRPTSGADPITSKPAAALLTARTNVASNEKPSAAATFPAKHSERLHERVRIVFHVP